LSKTPLLNIALNTQLGHFRDESFKSISFTGSDEVTRSNNCNNKNF